MLKWFTKQLARRQEGFTLIELMVVVAILAVLAFLVLPRALEALDRSKLNSAQSVANEIANAMERQAAQNGEAARVEYPADTVVLDNDWATLVASVAGVAKVPDANTARKYFAGPDATTITFDYETNATRSSYSIALTAEDNAGTAVCIKPGGISVGAAAAPCTP